MVEKRYAFSLHVGCKRRFKKDFNKSNLSRRFFVSFLNILDSLFVKIAQSSHKKDIYNDTDPWFLALPQ